MIINFKICFFSCKDVEKLSLYTKTRLKYLLNLERYETLLNEELDFKNSKFLLEILQILYKKTKFEKEKEKILVSFF